MPAEEANRYAAALRRMREGGPWCPRCGTEMPGAEPGDCERVRYAKRLCDTCIAACLEILERKPPPPPAAD